MAFLVEHETLVLFIAAVIVIILSVLDELRS